MSAWLIDVGVSSGKLTDGSPKRRQWKRRTSLSREPLISELTDLQKVFSEVRATSSDGKIEIIWTRHSKARRTFLVDAPSLGV